MDSPFNASNPDPRQLKFDGSKTLPYTYTITHIENPGEIQGQRKTQGNAIEG